MDGLLMMTAGIRRGRRCRRGSPAAARRARTAGIVAVAAGSLILFGAAPAQAAPAPPVRTDAQPPGIQLAQAGPSSVKTPQEEEFGPQLPPPPPPAAVVVKPRGPKFAPGNGLVAVRAGAAFPEVVSNFGPSFIVGAEVGWAPRLPRIGEGFALTIDFAYSQPEANVKITDTTRVDAGATASLTQREYSFGLTLLYRVQKVKQGKVTPYLGIGPRLFLLQTLAKTSQGANVGTTYLESSTRIGMGIPVGVDFALGPGRLFGEAMFLYAPFNHNVTGATNAGALTVEVGYRYLFRLGG
jgi:opacity family porin